MIGTPLTMTSKYFIPFKIPDYSYINFHNPFPNTLKMVKNEDGKGDNSFALQKNIK